MILTLIVFLLITIFLMKNNEKPLKTKVNYAFAIPLLVVKPKYGYIVLWILIAIAVILLIYLIYLYIKKHQKVKEPKPVVTKKIEVVEKKVVTPLPPKKMPKTILNYSFESRVHLASPEAFARYEEIREKLLSYEDVKYNQTWKYERYTYRGKSIVKVKLQGKNMRLFFGIDPKEITDEKYNIEDMSTVKTHENTPSLLIVKGPRGVKHGMELIEQYAKTHQIKEKEDYIYEPLKFKRKTKLQLLKTGLIKTNNAEFIEQLEAEENLKSQQK